MCKSKLLHNVPNNHLQQLKYISPFIFYKLNRQFTFNWATADAVFGSNTTDYKSTWLCEFCNHEYLHQMIPISSFGIANS